MGDVRTLSVLWEGGEVPAETTPPPACFRDLNLDQVVAAVAGERREFDVTAFFSVPLHDPGAVRYRQEVARDLEDETTMALVAGFTRDIGTVRRYLDLAGKLESPPHRQGWLLEAALLYAEAVAGFAGGLAAARLASRGLGAIRDYLAGYVSSAAFRALADGAREAKEALAGVRYALLLEPGKVTVRRCEDERDYSVEVERTFARFKQVEARPYDLRVPERRGGSYVEARILESVAALFPEPFARLRRFCDGQVPFLDPVVDRFVREVQFYLAYLGLVAGLRRQGLPFCYPEVSATDKGVELRDAFGLDLVVGGALEPGAVVLNDVVLRGPERVLVVTGPNQGGKTSYARMVGQAHYLASLGLPVPARAARLFLCDQVLTHFERAEEVRSLRGKLEDDLLRLRDLLSRATPRSLFVLNEIFTSTSADDALALSREVMARLEALDALAVWVTFLDQVVSFSARAVSVVAQVDPGDPSVRTFRLVRQPADGLAHALSLARKHGLSDEQVRERLAR
jgi:hypothetical protein